jgi:hypothetical protein
LHNTKCSSHKDWYQWGYDDTDWLGRRISHDQKFSIRYLADNVKTFSFSDALDYNLKTFLNDYPDEKYAILLSGGTDSETVFRTFIRNNVDFVPYIFRYENDSNIYDVSYAITLCESHEKKYHLVDLNLKKFYETEAEKISELAQIDQPRLLPQLKFLDYIDEMPIASDGHPLWFRRNESYNQSGIWEKIEFEFYLGWEKYLKYTNRKASMLWLKYTPELSLAFDQTSWLKKLINDGFYGKRGMRSTKFQAQKEVNPEMIFRKKQTGFEKVEDLTNEFEQFLYKKYNGLPYRGSVVVQRHLAGFIL